MWWLLLPNWESAQLHCWHVTFFHISEQKRWERDKDIKKARSRGGEVQNEYNAKVPWGFTGFWEAPRGTRPRISPWAGRVIPRGAYFSATDYFCTNSQNGSVLSVQDLIARHLFHRYVAQPLHYLFQEDIIHIYSYLAKYISEQNSII